MKILQVPCLVVVLAGFLSAPLPAQDTTIAFDHITTEDGLSDDRVMYIIQDSRGFMWIGTLSGLDRYDGYEFKQFRYESDNPHSLSDNQVRYLYEDQEEVLWVGTWNGGLNRYDRKTESFVRYEHNPADPHSLSNNQIQSICEDSAGSLWIGTIDGLNRLDRETGDFTRFQHDPNNPNSLSHNMVRNIVADRDGVLWLATYGGGLEKLISGEGDDSPTFVHYQHDPANPRSLSSDQARFPYVDREGVLWVATWGWGLNRFDPQTEQFTRYRHDAIGPHSLGHDQVAFVHEDRTGSLWVGTLNGLDKFDRVTKQFTHFRHDPADPNSLSHNQLIALYEDRAGAIWIATLGGGVNKLDRDKSQFRHYRSHPTNPDSQGVNDVRAIHYGRDGLLWIGAFGHGLTRMDRNAETYTRYRHDPADPTSLPNDAIWVIHEGRSDVLWVGTLGGLGKLDRKTETFRNFRNDPTDPSSLSNNTVYSILADRSGVLWVGTNTGLNRLDADTERFTRYLHDPNDPGSLSNHTITRIHEGQSGGLWIATWGGGLNRLDRDTGRFTNYRHDPDDPKSLSHDSVFAVHQDREGVLWIATSGGLNRLVTRDLDKGGTFDRYTVDEGLPNDTVWGILEDDDGNLWLSTSQGLSQFNPRTKLFQNYDVSDGLQSNTFNAMSSYDKSSSGELFFGGVNGFNAFYPADIRRSELIPAVVVTDFQLVHNPVPLGANSVLRQSIVETDALVLSYQDRVVSFRFAALDYRAPEKNRYRYKLEGLEVDWHEVDSNERQATYTNLAPREYVFRVQGSNNHHVWNEEGVSIRVTVTPPWTQTWWFRAAILGTIAGLILGAHGIRMRYIVRRKEALEQEVIERTKVEQDLRESQATIKSLAGELIVTQEAERRRIARELHDDLSQKLAAIGIGLSRLKGRLSQTEPETTDHVEGLQQVTADISRDVRRLSHGLHPSTIEHVGLAVALRSLCDELSGMESITINVNLPEVAAPRPPDVVLSFYRITQECLQNIKKHSKASEARVTLTETASDLRLVISDNGVGFDVENVGERKGLGLVSMEERVRLVEGTFQIRSVLGKGTEVEVRVPLRP